MRRPLATPKCASSSRCRPKKKKKKKKRNKLTPPTSSSCNGSTATSARRRSTCATSSRTCTTASFCSPFSVRACVVPLFDQSPNLFKQQKRSSRPTSACTSAARPRRPSVRTSTWCSRCAASALALPFRTASLTVRRFLGYGQTQHTTPIGVIEKDFVSIARLCVQLAHKLKCPYQLPSNIEVVVVHRESMKSGSMTKTSRYPITGNESSYGSLEADLIHGMQGASLDGKTSEYGWFVCGNWSLLTTLDASELFTTHERDAIDELFEPHNAEKLQAVKTVCWIQTKQRQKINNGYSQLLSAFVNKHLASCGLQVNDLMNQFHDGVYLVILVGALGKFFVPLYNYKIAPTTTDEKVNTSHCLFFFFNLAGDLIPRFKLLPDRKRQLFVQTHVTTEHPERPLEGGGSREARGPVDCPNLAQYFHCIQECTCMIQLLSLSLDIIRKNRISKIFGSGALCKKEKKRQTKNFQK